MVPKIAARLGDIHQTYITFWKHRYYPFSRMRLRLNGYHVHLRTETGLEAIERLHFLASFPLPGTGREARKRNLSIASLPTPLDCEKVDGGAVKIL